VQGVDSFLCGCGDGVEVPGAPCLSNVAADFCGAVPFTGSAVPSVPDVICGCDTNPSDSIVVKYMPGSAQPCLSTLANTVCGSKVVCTAETFNTTQGDCPDGQLCVNYNPGVTPARGDACVTPQ